jgi:hypothetical protein
MGDSVNDIVNAMDDLERGFHNRDGWFFRRDSDDGNVRIWKVRWETREVQGQYVGKTPVLEAGPFIVPENEWASIVAAVSRGGENGESWRYARHFHNGHVDTQE